MKSKSKMEGIQPEQKAIGRKRNTFMINFLFKEGIIQEEGRLRLLQENTYKEENFIIVFGDGGVLYHGWEYDEAYPIIIEALII